MPLTMDNDGAALVPGAAPQQRTRRVRVVRPFMWGGKPTKYGQELALPAAFAAEMVSAGKAGYVVEPAPETAAEKPPARKPKE